MDRGISQIEEGEKKIWDSATLAKGRRPSPSGDNSSQNKLRLPFSLEMCNSQYNPY